MPYTRNGKYIESDGPEVAALAQEISNRLDSYYRKKMTRHQIHSEIEVWLYSMPRDVPEYLYLEAFYIAWDYSRWDGGPQA